MTTPEEALERARAAAARRRGEGVYPPPGPAALDATIVADPPDAETLAEWAVIEVDEGVLYSTQRYGRPVTVLKRVLARLLRQYHVEIESQQTRFNMALLAHVRTLEARVEVLERLEKEGTVPGPRSSPGSE